MKTYKTWKSPCVPVLASLTRATADEYHQGTGIHCVVDREKRLGQIQMPMPDGTTAYCWINSLEAMREALRELLVLEADLKKLWGLPTVQE